MIWLLRRVGAQDFHEMQYRYSFRNSKGHQTHFWSRFAPTLQAVTPGRRGLLKILIKCNMDVLGLLKATELISGNDPNLQTVAAGEDRSSVSASQWEIVAWKKGKGLTCRVSASGDRWNGRWKQYFLSDKIVISSPSIQNSNTHIGTHMYYIKYLIIASAVTHGDALYFSLQVIGTNLFYIFSYCCRERVPSEIEIHIEIKFSIMSENL